MNSEGVIYGKLDRRINPKITGTSPNAKTTPAAATQNVCMAPVNRGPKHKLQVWPAVKKSPSTSKTSKVSKLTTSPKLQAHDKNTVILSARGPNNTDDNHQIDRRIPFPTDLPAVDDTPAANWAHMSQIIANKATFNFFADGGYSNSFTRSASVDQQIATKEGGLAGCTILISYTQNILYFSHHWEVPGFNKLAPKYPTINFDAEVKGFLIGAPNSYGEGLPLVAPNVPKADQPMLGASTQIITVGASSGFKSASYKAKIKTIADLTDVDLNGKSSIFAYKRPYENEPTIRLTVEFCAANRHLRVMIADTRSGDYGGTRVIDKNI
jgi:hypothetical protein